MAVWFVRSSAAGTGTGADWTNAKTTLAAAATAAAAGDTIWIANDSAETQASAMTITSPGTAASPVFIYCVDHTVASPGTSDVKSDPYTTTSPACAMITTTGNNNMALAGIAYCYGVVFNCGTGAVAASITASGGWIFENCSLRKLGTSAATAAIGLTTDASYLINTTVQFGAIGDQLTITGGVVWKNTNASSAIIGATSPTSLFRINTVAPLSYILGVDLSGVGTNLLSTMAAQFSVVFEQCKMSAGVAITAAAPTNRAANVYWFNCDSAGTNYRHQQQSYAGTLQQETTIVRTGGTSDGTTAYSWNITTNANAKWVIPFSSFPLPIWNATTGSNVTVTVNGIINAAAVPNNDDVWIETVYPGSASTPLGSLKNSTKSNNLASGSALTADSSSAWDSLVTARANTTAYTLGQTIKLASNSGRIFFCTTPGTSSGSEPVGYASAVDGGSVTDNTAVFRAGCRFSMAVTLTSPQPQFAGPLRITVMAAKASTTWYVDPTANLS